MLADATFRDRAVYLPARDALVVADLHLGKARASNVEFPLGERADIRDRLETLLDRFAPERVVIAGDLLHAFDRVPRAVEDAVTDLHDLIGAAGAEPVVIAGNHDAMLDSLLGDASEDYRLGDALVCHGHARPDSEAPLYIIGHEHPAITIEGRKRPCYLIGPAVDGTERLDGTRSSSGTTAATSRVLVLPAFTRLASGIDVGRARTFQSPLLARPGEYRPIVRDEDGNETLRFPPLSEFRSFI